MPLQHTLRINFISVLFCMISIEEKEMYFNGFVKKNTTICFGLCFCINELIFFKLCMMIFFFFCTPQLYLWGSPFVVRFLCMIKKEIVGYVE